MSKESELPSVPYRSGNVVVEAWGTLYDHPSYCRPASASTLPHMVLPVGYKVRVPLPSYIQEGVTVDYLCDVQQGESGPIFRVCASDDEHNPSTSDSATGAFQEIFKRRVGAKVGSVNGLSKLGLSTTNILKQLRKLPNAQPIFERLDAAVNFRPSTRPARVKSTDGSPTDLVVVEGEQDGTDGAVVTVVEGTDATATATVPKQRKPRKAAVPTTDTVDGVPSEPGADVVEIQADATGSATEGKPKRVYRKRVREDPQAATTGSGVEPAPGGEVQPIEVNVDEVKEPQVQGEGAAPVAPKIRKPRAKKANPTSIPEGGASEEGAIATTTDPAQQPDLANPTGEFLPNDGEVQTVAQPPAGIPSKRQQRKRLREGEEGAAVDGEGGAPKSGRGRGAKGLQPTLTQFLATGDQGTTGATQEVVEVAPEPVVKKVVPSILPALDGGDRKKARSAFEAEVEAGAYPFPEALLQNIKNRKRFRMFQWMYMSERAKYELCRKQKGDKAGTDHAAANEGPAAAQPNDTKPPQGATVPVVPISIDENSNSVPPKGIATPLKRGQKGREHSNSVSIVSNPQPSPAKPEEKVAPKSVSGGRASTSRGRSKRGE
jgi:hypothetical protein